VQRVEFLRASDTWCGKRVQIKKCGPSGFLPIALLLTSPASEESRSSFLSNRVLPEHRRVSQPCPADDPGAQVRSGELLDEFTFSFTDRNLTELCLSAEFPP
jgi:hypothetical protein